MLTARERFRASSDASKLAELVETPWFQQAIEVAQHEFVESLPAPADEVTARANAWRIDGMRWFRAILLGIASPEALKPPAQQAKPILRRP